MSLHNGTCLCLLFWMLRLHTSGFVLVISRRLDAAHNRPPSAPAAPVSADSVPYQQSLHPEIQHPANRRTLLRSTRPGTTVQKWPRPQSVSFALKWFFIFFWDIRGFARFEDAERLWRHPWHKRMLRVGERERPNSSASHFWKKINNNKLPNWSSIFLFFNLYFT